MKTASTLAAIGTAIGISLATAAPAGADVTRPIGPNQFFRGQVNGVQAQATIRVVCPGPITPGETGPTVSGQTISVTDVLSGFPHGAFTGSAGTSVVAGFTSSAPGQFFRFTDYGAPQEIPSTLRLPCGGTDTMNFVPEPTSDTAEPDQVVITFDNIAK